MPHAALWRDLHRVDVWELSAFPRKCPSSSEAKTSQRFSIRELGTAAHDRWQAEENYVAPWKIRESTYVE